MFKSNLYDGKWKRWYAWYPVKDWATGEILWLQPVWYCLIDIGSWYSTTFEYKYSKTKPRSKLDFRRFNPLG